jgi:hypothetical protein
VRRAREGERSLVLYEGKPVLVADSYDEEGRPIGPLKPLYETKRSDNLLMFTLKARRPDKFRDNSRVEMTGAGGGPVKLEDTTGIDAARRIACALAKAAEALPPDN